ncbi:unnamed protein product [Ambrosiozyma monospora]|uniref:Unnamed protein product n=1 Tax=Ambrosiozyma monospora TaxID=43982 RepID=A0A9W6Z064_AMBMO|nr:unnamed protein product [Ambrosiozyma monospora]
MLKTQIRRIGYTAYRQQSSILSKLTKIGVLEQDGNQISETHPSVPTETSKPHHHSPTKRDKKSIIDGPYLNDHFKSLSAIQIKSKVPNSQVSNISNFFNDARVDLDWSIYEYNKIPGEEKRLKDEEQSFENEEITEQENEENNDEFDKYEHDTAPKKNTKEHELGLKPGRLKYLQKQQAKIQKEDLHNNLSEIIMMGRCNVGKSSLINALVSNNKESVTKYARVRQFAGYTPCLNFYNVGGLFRLVDSPGYGVKGKDWQGELVFDMMNSF